MLALYVFCLVLGGTFLGLSLLGGIGGADADVDALGDGDLHADPGDGDSHAGHDLHASKVFSLRTVVYALFGFGSVGTALTLAGAGSLVTAASSAAGGLASATIIHQAFRYLKRTDSGGHAGDASFVGLPGTVTLPLAPGVPGTIAVQRGNRRIALRALPHQTGGAVDASRWRSVVVVDMSEGIARVAPVDEDLNVEP